MDSAPNSSIHYWLVKRLSNQHNVACHPSVLRSSLTVQHPPFPLYFKHFFLWCKESAFPSEVFQDFLCAVENENAPAAFSLSEVA